MIRTISFLILLSFQTGFARQNLFKFTSLPFDARTSALGGVSITDRFQDPLLVISNPVLLDAKMKNNFSFSYTGYLADIKLLSAAYVFDLKNTGSWGLNFNYVNYGEIKSYDDTGTETGTYSPKDLEVGISKSHSLGPYKIGGTLKFLQSDVAGYKNTGFLIDAGGLFIHPEKDFTIGLLLNNAGISFSNYTSAGIKNLPLDLIVASAFKPVHMPVRIHLTLNRLLNWRDKAFKENTIPTNSALHAFSHLTVGSEFLLGKSLSILAGYNFARRENLAVYSNNRSAGLSLGASLSLKKLSFSFGRGNFHAAGGSNTFTFIYKPSKNNI